MNFLSLRAQLQNWTLDSDDKLYRAIKQLSDTVLEAQKLILNNIQTTRYQVNRGLVESGCSYNHYLRVSQTKFTQNKIGEKKIAQKEQKNIVKTESKNKMDIFKQAIQIGTKNLQITQQKNADADLISMSDTSLSQSIYKDCRVPAFYGTKQFATNSFLNLFSENQLNIAIPSQKFQTNTLVMNNQLPQASSLAPPPSLQQTLNQNYSTRQQGNLDLLPPPPPPPLTISPPTLPSLPSLPGASLPLPPILPGLLGNNNLPQIPPFTNMMQSSNVQKVEIRQNVQVQQTPIKVAPKPKGPLSMQQQLALRLKHGKNYKQQIEVNVEVRQQISKTETKKNQTIIEKNNKLEEVIQQRQSLQSSNIRASLRNSYGGININQMINPNSIKTAPNNQKPTHDAVPQQIQQQEVDSFFGPSKSKARQTKRVVNVQNDIMKRQTFNQNILFKKKPVQEKKQIQKPKNSLFADDNEEQSESFSFKKKQDKQKSAQLPKLPQKTGKKQNKGILDSDSDEDSSNLFKKKKENKPKPQTQTQSEPNTNPLISKNSLAQKNEPKQQIKVVAKQQSTPKLNPLFQPSAPKQEVQIKVTIKAENTPKLNPLFQPSTPKQTKKSEVEENTLAVNKNEDENISQQRRNSSHATSYAQKVAAMGGFGGMGMMMLPKGMVITKPSQAKKNEEEARKRQQQQQQRLAKQQQLRRQEMEKIQQQKRRQQIQEQQRQRIQTQIKREQQQIQRNQQMHQKQILENEIEQKISLPSLPKIQNTNSTKKAPNKNKNGLFDDQEQQDDTFFKPKPKILTQKSQLVKPTKDQQVSQNLRKTQYIEPAPKQQVVPIKSQISIKVQPNAQTIQIKTDLNVRRKKAKPSMNTNNVFAEQQKPTQKQVLVSNQQKLNQQLSKAKIEEENKKIQQKLILQQQQKMKQQIQRKQKEQLQQKKKQQMIRKAQQDRQRQLKQENQRKRQQELRKQEEQRLKKEQQRIQFQRWQQQKRKQQARKQQQQRMQQAKRLQEQRKKIQQQKRRKEQERIREQQQRKRAQQERQRENEERVRKQQERKRIQQQKKQQEAQKAQLPFLPKLPSKLQTSNNPLGGPLLSKVSKPIQNNKGQKKGGLFADDDEESQLTFNKVSKPSITKTLNTNTGTGQAKKGLFDDDDDDNSNFLIKKPVQTKPKVEVAKSKKLFDDYEDNQQILGAKPKTNITQNKPPLQSQYQKPVSEPIKLPSKQIASKQNESAKKKSLFDDDDDDIMDIKISKKPASNQTPKLGSQAINNPIKAPVATTQQPAKKKGIFDDDDDDDGGLNFKKPTTNQQSTAAQKQNSISTQAKKSPLFGQQDSDDSFTAKQQKKKREAAKKVRPF